VTDGIPQPALRGPFLKRERKAKRHGAVALHATQAGDLRRKANAIKKIEPPRLLVAHAAQPLAPRENVPVARDVPIEPPAVGTRLLQAFGQIGEPARHDLIDRMDHLRAPLAGKPQPDEMLAI